MLSPELRATAGDILAAAPCQVVLPAGCGKTELVAAVTRFAVSDNQRVLVLTHTHAGVEALRRRLRRYDVSSTRAPVRTIASWVTRLVGAYPGLADHAIADEPDWSQINTAVCQLLSNPHLADVIRQSYDLVIVDEYQDCTEEQHRVVLALLQLRPVILFGDPLQAIYDFDSSAPLVDWDADLAAFGAHVLTPIPWRWTKANTALGRYLLEIRAPLLAGEPIDLRDSPIAWVEDTPENQRQQAWRMTNTTGSAVILARFDAQCASHAQRLKGRFTVMENVDGTSLRQAAAVVDGGEGPEAAAAVLAFAKACFASLPSPLTSKVDKLKRGSFPGYKPASKSGPALAALERFAADLNPTSLGAFLDEIEKLGGTLYRQEAWRDLRRSVKTWHEGGENLTASVQFVRDRVRVIGRKVPGRSVSRAVLVKGLEFDHAAVMGADGMRARELYVALTRARTSVVVLSASPTIAPS